MFGAALSGWLSFAKFAAYHGRMIKRSLVLLALCTSACMESGPTPEQQQQRIAELEQQNTQLQGELKQAKDDVAALQRAMSHPEATSDAAVEAPAGPVAPTPVDPTPQNNIGAQ